MLKAKREPESGSSKDKKDQKKPGDRPSWPKRMFSLRRKQTERAGRENGEARQKESGKDKEKADAPPKKIPVFFIDEAHKL